MGTKRLITQRPMLQNALNKTPNISKPPIIKRPNSCVEENSEFFGWNSSRLVFWSLTEAWLAVIKSNKIDRILGDTIEYEYRKN